MWFSRPSVEDINRWSHGTMLERIGIEITELGEDYLKARMPVDQRTKQPAGLLHGGASAALAETLGSIASTLTIDSQKKQCVGLEINANHIRPVFDGFVEGIARPIHIGGKTQVWEIRIYTPEEKLVCVSRLTLAVLNK